jgi:hypothetical protein
MNVKIYSSIALLISLFLILLINPAFINNLYSTILGRLLFIIIIVFCASSNVTLGLLAALILILAINKYILIEGIDNLNSSIPISTPDTDYSIDEPSIGSIPVITRDTDTETTTTDSAANTVNKKPIKVSNDLPNAGIDTEDIKNSMQAKSSNTIPINKGAMSSSENVNAHTPSMLKNTSSLTEGFCPCAASLY